MSKDENVKTIRFPVATDDKLQKLADKCGLTKLAFFVAMVDYFNKTKKDPRDLNDELLKNAINRKTDNIISFVRTQEQDLLIPLKRESERMINVQVKIVDYFNKHVIRHNDEQKAACLSQSKSLESIATSLQTLLQEKSHLKSRFSFILETYIKSREQMGMMTKQAEKDELIRHVREQVKNL
jgi:hypothetical protein